MKWILTIVALAALAGCGTEKAAPPVKNVAAAKPDTAVIAADSPQLAQIRTEAVQTALVPVGSVTAPGKVEANANRLSHVVLPLTGRVTAVYVKIGDFVKQGQPLVQVESSDADAAVSQRQQAQAAVTQARSALAKAQNDLDRQKDLYEHGAVPQKEVLNAQALMVQAQAALEQAQAASEQARRRLELLGLGNASYGQRVTVSAPISGKVLELSVVPGEFRNDLSAPVATVADLSSVWVTCDVPETSIRLVKRGEPAHIALAAYPKEQFHGRVTQIGDVVDPQTRTVKVRAELPNPDGRLKPEMYGNIELAEQTETRPTVPATAVIATEGKSVVWRETSRGVFERVGVVAVPQGEGRMAILAGLRANDRVVVEGVMLLSAN